MSTEHGPVLRTSAILVEPCVRSHQRIGTRKPMACVALLCAGGSSRKSAEMTTALLRCGRCINWDVQRRGAFMRPSDDEDTDMRQNLARVHFPA
jgi:hypothetical protein